MKCSVCDADCEELLTCFPQRQGQASRPFYAALYFSDPFFGGDGSNYCSPACSLKHYEEKRNARTSAELSDTVS